MDDFKSLALHVTGIGILATAIMDLWLLMLKRLGVPTLDFALMGRWAGHLARGRWFHDRIAASTPVRGEWALGVLFHYAVGIAFSGVMLALGGKGALVPPSPWLALSVGVGSLVAPFFILQPAMGAGIASSKTPTPGKNRLRSVANHLVFGMGLYGAALLVASLSR